jgi:hypothetical protein
MVDYEGNGFKLEYEIKALAAALEAHKALAKQEHGKQDNYQGSDEAKAAHMMDLYTALGVKWGEDPFAVIAKMRSIAEAEKQEQGEPVAYDVRCDNCGGDGYDPKNNNYYCSVCEGSRFVEKILYTTPPERTWVGLTDDDIEKAYEQAEKKEPYMGAVTRKGIAEAFEQILKEKNT